MPTVAKSGRERRRRDDAAIGSFLRGPSSVKSGLVSPIAAQNFANLSRVRNRLGGSKVLLMSSGSKSTTMFSRFRPVRMRHRFALGAEIDRLVMRFSARGPAFDISYIGLEAGWRKDRSD